MAHLSLSLLGEFQATLAGESVTGFHSDKVRALLAYLAVEAAQPHTRAQLAGLFWPDWPEQTARTYLRQALFDLRRLLGDSKASTPFLLANHRTIQFNPRSDFSLDVAALVDATDLAARETSPLTREELEQLQQVASRCTGSFLEGFFLDGCSAYEEWQLLTRERLRRQVSQLLRTLITGFEQIGDLRQALQQAWLHVELEPLLDAAHWQVIHLLSLTGDPGAALAHYRRYCRILDEELGAEPAVDVTMLIEQIRTAPSPSIVQPMPDPAESLSRRETSHIPLPASISAAAPATARLPFVARESELAQLAAHLAETQNAQGRVVFICGDAGQGKTTLLQEFVRLAQQRHPALVVATGSCDAHTGIGDPYQPFREIVGLLTGDIETPWRARTISRAQAISLWQTFPLTVGRLLEEGPDLIGALVSARSLLARVVDSGLDDYVDTERLRRSAAGERSTASRQQAALFEQTVALLRAVAERAPLVLLLEDLHWADPGTINLLFHLGRHLAGSTILVVGSYRPEEIALGRNGGPHPLTPVLNEFRQVFGESTVDLRASDGRGFVEALLDTQPNRLGATFRETLYEQSQGHALFTVELLRAMQERGDLKRGPDGRWIEGAVNWEALPARVEAAIAQRISRLPASLLSLLSVASVEGERFSAETVAQISGVEPQEAIRWLSAELDRKYRLVVAHGIRRVKEIRLSQYRFRHILFQKYLYGSLDDVERTHLHEKVALTLEQIYADSEEELHVYVPRLAHHFHQARIYDKAMVYLHHAAALAVNVAANEEAITHLRTALSLLAYNTDADSRAEQELALQVLLGVALGHLYGEGNPIVEPVHSRVLALAEQIEDTGSRFNALHDLWLYHWLRGDLDSADRFAQQMLALAKMSRGRMPSCTAVAGVNFFMSKAYAALGHNCFTAGALVEGRAHFDRAIGYGAVAGDDLVASARQFLAHSLWVLGYPDQARAQIETLRVFARSDMHPYDLAHVRVGAMALYQYRQEAEEMREAAETALALSNKYGFAQWSSWSAFMHGWATAKLSGGSQGLDEMEAGAAAWPGPLWGARKRAIMADAYATAGRTRQGLALLNEALEIVERTGERLFEAEIHRLKGELLLMLVNEEKEGIRLAEIEACFPSGYQDCASAGGEILGASGNGGFEQAVVRAGATEGSAN